MIRILLGVFLAAAAVGDSVAESPTEEHQRKWDEHRKRSDAERRQKEAEERPTPAAAEAGQESKPEQPSGRAKTN